MELVILGIQ